MGGRNCCVINCRRRSHDHLGRKIPSGLTFHCFPTWRTHEGEQIARITKRRRAAWVAAVGRSDITFSHIPSSMRVCSRHFRSGKPAYEMLESDPDWVPTLHLGHSEGKPRRSERLLKSVQEDRDQRRPAETRPSHETQTAAAAGRGPERPAVRPWREVKSLLKSALQRKTDFSQQPVRKTNLDFRDFFRDALEASLEASSRSRALSARQPSSGEEYSVELSFKLPPVQEENHTCEEPSSSSSSCVNCVRLQRRILELEEKLSCLTGRQEDMEVSAVLNKAPVQPEQDLQSPETAHTEEQDSEWMEPVSPPQDTESEGDQDEDSAGKWTAQEDELDSSKRKRRRTRRFQKAWLKMFWFLRYSPTLDLMWCHVCRLHMDKSHRNKGLIKGSRVFKFHNIKHHSSSNYHKASVSRHMLHMCNLQL